jgi:ketosteroid isomerase-like protein
VVSTETVTLTSAEVEAQIRAVFETWKTLDPRSIADLYSGGVGFGYRTREARPPYETKEAYLEALQSWLGRFEHYTITVEQIETTVDGDIGLAWGFYKEEFALRGREPEVIRGRFSEVVRRDPSGWRTLLYHRDTQPFDSADRYIPSAVHHG